MGYKAEKYIDDVGFENYKVVKKVSLNFFDVTKNSNKFYTIEIHEKNGNVRVFTDYGRLGVTSKKEIRRVPDVYSAEHEFDTIKRSKERKGYVEVELAQSNTGSSAAKELIDVTKIKQDKTTKKTKAKSKLPTEIQEFVKQIFDEANRTLNTLVKGNVSSDGASPLGKLSLNQINKGKSILQQIANILNSNPNATYNDVLALSNEFYRYIPKTFGKKIDLKDMAISSLSKVSDEMDILQFYESALSMGNILLDTTEIDKKYDSLKTDIGVLDPNSKTYKDLVKYVRDSQSKHHRVNLEVKRIFTVDQHNGMKFDDSVGNVKQLFHGTRSANVAAILGSHLKLPNQLKGVYITGAMFGPGLYFADQSTKSSQYSCARFGGTVNKYKSSFMFVADVALGKVKEVENSHYFYDAPKGYDSVKGVEGRSLLHNEYIVYNEERAKLRYIIEFEPHNR